MWLMTTFLNKNDEWRLTITLIMYLNFQLQNLSILSWQILWDTVVAILCSK